MAYAEQTKNVAGTALGLTALAVGDYVRSVSTRTGFVRVYDPTLGGTATASKTNLPQVSNIIVHSQHDDAAPWYRDGGLTGTIDAGTAQVGMVEVFLTVPAADSVNAASVQTFKVDSNAVVVVATSASS